MPNKSQKRRAEMAQKAYGTVIDMGRILRIARLASGLTVGYMSKCMGVSSTDDWLEYKHNRQPIPGHIIIKLMIFGMEFWARNQESFEYASNDHPVASRHPSTGGELGTQTNI